MKWYVFIFILGVAAALFLNETTHLVLFPVALLGLALIDWRAYRIFRRWKMWLFFILLLLIPVLLVNPKDAEWLGIPCNRRMFQLNLIMVERSILIMLSLKLFTNHISLDSISAGLKRLRLHQFEQVFRLAMTLLPQVRAIAAASFKGIHWRMILVQRAGLFKALSQFIAQIIFQTRQAGSHAGEGGNKP